MDNNRKKITCLAKLYPKYATQTNKIVNMIDSQTTSSSLEVQQRACEYLKLIEKDWDDNRAAILETMPICPSFSTSFSDKNVGDIEIDEIPPQQNNPGVLTKNLEKTKAMTAPNPNKTAGNDAVNLIDLDELIGKDNQEGNNLPNINNNNNAQNPMNLNVLNDIFSSTNPMNITNPTPASGNLMSLYGMGSTAPMLGNPQGLNQNPNLLLKTVDLMESGDLLGGENKSAGLVSPGGGLTSPGGQNSSFKAFEDQNIELVFQCAKVYFKFNLMLFHFKENNDTTNIVSYFNNKTGTLISDIVFQVAVLKHLKLTMNPINSNKINPGSRGEVTQVLLY